MLNQLSKVLDVLAFVLIGLVFSGVGIFLALAMFITLAERRGKERRP